MLISQIKDASGKITVAVREEGGQAQAVKGAASVYALAMEAANGGKSLADVISAHGLGDAVDLEAAYAEGRFLPPITHPDPAHLHLTGTGLTHLGSAATRDSMHKKTTEAAEESLTDSMKMFRMGLENGKPKAGEKGVQPEWFYKGNGHVAAAPGAALTSPSFALDGGEEPEMAGIYVISDKGEPVRIGFAVSNEFSDHVTERVNYLYLAHSKLRPASFGPEIRVGAAPSDIRGTSRIRRGDKVIFEKPFVWVKTTCPHLREPRISPLQIRPVPCARRCACAHVRHGNALLRRWHQAGSGRRLRDRGSRFRPAAEEPAGRGRGRRDRRSADLICGLTLRMPRGVGSSHGSPIPRRRPRA